MPLEMSFYNEQKKHKLGLKLELICIPFLHCYLGINMTMSFPRASFLKLFALSWIMLCNTALSEPEQYKSYIIRVDPSYKPSTFSTDESWHRSMFRTMSDSIDDNQGRFLYSYKHVMPGFSARLTPAQLSNLERSHAHVATHEDSIGKLHTTHTPEFLGLTDNNSLWPAASFGEGVIVGLIDSGIWPESQSFSDDGMPIPPKRWKGKCHPGTTGNFSCNRKLIGAEAFIKGIEGLSEKQDDSPRDHLGHGTHTSSTAAGNYAFGASQFGYANGVARGMAPHAHLAMYKVSNTPSIAESDVLAAMDQAIEDGVDIMSLSLGFGRVPYYLDLIAIAAFSAIEKGILVVCSAGNSGPKSVMNAAPWITTVGAGTIDRSFIARLTLANGQTLEGSSQFPASIYISNATLFYGRNDLQKSICSRGSLNKTEVEQKVVFCAHSLRNSYYEQLVELERVGAYAGILISEFDSDSKIPIVFLSNTSRNVLELYVNSTSEPLVESVRFGLTKLGVKTAPQVADFSSRGPDSINPSLLKPDILAPGVDILAAIPSVPVPFFSAEIFNYELVTDYALFSGTSMAAPHIAGLAALLKTVHPEWSPAGIRSAMMTTAYTKNNNGTSLQDQETGLAATPLDYGAGHVDPNEAMNPGLIYDLGSQDYINFLCSLGYNTTQMKIMLRRDSWNCSDVTGDLNYPSFMLVYGNGSNSSNVRTFHRVVTNVGDDSSTYQAKLESPTGLKITVEPSSLTFTHKYEKQSFSVIVEADINSPWILHGRLSWIDKKLRVVSSPVVAINRKHH